MNKVYIKCGSRRDIVNAVSEALYALFCTEYNITVNDIRMLVNKTVIYDDLTEIVVDDEIDDETAYGWPSLSPDDLKSFDIFKPADSRYVYVLMLPSPIKFKEPVIRDSNDAVKVLTDGDIVMSRTPHKWLVEQIKLAGQELIDKAEELVPAGDSSKDYYITIDFDPNETPVISVSFDHYDHKRIEKLKEKYSG